MTIIKITLAASKIFDARLCFPTIIFFASSINSAARQLSRNAIRKQQQRQRDERTQQPRRRRHRLPCEGAGVAERDVVNIRIEHFRIRAVHNIGFQDQHLIEIAAQKSADRKHEKEHEVGVMQGRLR